MEFFFLSFFILREPKSKIKEASFKCEYILSIYEFVLFVIFIYLFFPIFCVCFGCWIFLYNYFQENFKITQYLYVGQSRIHGMDIYIYIRSFFLILKILLPISK